MKVYVNSICENQFEIVLPPNAKIQALKEQIVDHFVNALSITLPKENKLIHKGCVLEENSKTVSELQIEDQSRILFLYNLKQATKVIKPEQKVILQQPELKEEKEEKEKEEKQEEENKQIKEEKEGIEKQPKEENERIPQEHQFTPEELERFAFVASQIDWENFPMPNPDDLERMMETGFSKWRCQKALLLNSFDPEQALDWLCTNIDSSTIDDPLSTIQFAQIMMDITRQMNENQEEQNNALSEAMKEAVKNNKCTFTVTGPTFVQQKWFFCYTCGFVDSEGVCEGCAKVCHLGHSLSAVRGVDKGSGFYCDCGASSSCICNK